MSVPTERRSVFSFIEFRTRVVWLSPEFGEKSNITFEHTQDSSHMRDEATWKGRDLSNGNRKSKVV